MEFRALTVDPGTLPGTWGGDGLVVGVVTAAEGEPGVPPQLESLLGSNAATLLEQRRFKGKPGECLSLDRIGETPSVLILVGLGSREELNLSVLRTATAAAARSAVRSGVNRLGLWIPTGGLEPDHAAAAMAEAVRLALYRDQRFRSEPEPGHDPAEVVFLGLPEVAAEGLVDVDAICSGVEMARQLVAAPPNSATPQHLADTAAGIAADFDLELKVLERADCEALGMGAYLGVSQGSDLPPKFIHLTYRPSGPVQRRVALVGKGLTFDSGGYNLKVGAAQIEMMKYDMGGSAAVLGALRAVAQCRPEGVEVHGIVASCENMISGGAVHPGDIITASNGKTIEINNTDAEGRLTLADALVYACKLEPDAVVDLATLTGACVIALGNEIAGMWSSSDALADALMQAGVKGGEPLWRMPMPPSYKDGLKSQYADMKNTGPRAGGSITAALFLRDFVTPDLAWAHLDIAGTVWSDKGRDGNPAGATGYGVRTLLQWIKAGAEG